MNSARDGVRSDRIGVLLLGVLIPLILAGISGYLLTRMRVLEDDTVEVFGSIETVNWRSVPPLRPSLGLKDDGRYVTNAESSSDESAASAASTETYSALASTRFGNQIVRFRPGRYTMVPHTVVASRSIRNVYGQTLLRWSCSVSGAVSADGAQCCLSLTPTGGGVDGYTVSFEGVADDTNRFVVEITERLWTDSARSCRLEYQLHHDGRITFVGAL